MLEHYKKTAEHKLHVAKYLWKIAFKLISRSVTHDLSKFSYTESKSFAKVISKLGKIEYGSKEYTEMLKTLKPVLNHHYKCNPHHPEYYGKQIDLMSLIDMIEMFCDWKAAGKRNLNGSIDESIKINTKRFELAENQLYLFYKIKEEL